MINGKKYYGQTKRDNPWDRIKGHLYKAGKGKKTHLYDAIRKYGAENFKVYWLHYKCLTKEKADSYEKYYILANDARNPQKGYNMTEGGDGGDTMTGRNHTEETKQKMSNSAIGRKHTEESKKQMSEKAKGRKRTDEHNKKIGEANIGKKHTEESKKKMSEAKEGSIPWNKGKKLSEEHKRNLSIGQQKRRSREANKKEK